MNLDSIIFIDSLPKLDLHGFDRETARLAIQDFIRDCIKIKEPFCVIVHGNGSGILKETTAITLKKNKNVTDYKTYYFNTGCTIVVLKND